jgi:hypothetical protein
VLIFKINQRWSLCDWLNPCKKKSIPTVDYAEVNSKYITKENLTVVKVQEDELDESDSSSSISQKTDRPDDFKVIDKGQDLLADLDYNEENEINLQINKVDSSRKYNSVNLNVFENKLKEIVKTLPNRAQTEDNK